MWLEAFNDLRKRSGMSLDELSEKSGVPKGTLSKITSGITKSPSLETMRILVHAMGYTLDDLDPKEKAPTPSKDDARAKIEPEKLMNVLIEMGFVEPGKDLTDADLRFLISVGNIIRAWFAERK